MLCKSKNTGVVLGLIILVIATALFFIDRNVWMKKRVMHWKVWEYEKGDVDFIIRNDTICRSLLYTDNIVSFENNTLVFKDRIGNLVKYDTLEMKWSYFGRLRIVDPKTKKEALYLIFNKI